MRDEADETLLRTPMPTPAVLPELLLRTRVHAALFGRHLPATIGHARYAVLGELGAGAMGCVLRAYDPRLAREVAIKVLATDRSARARARLVREARALAQLSDPNVVAVHDVEVDEHECFIVMELVRGDTLQAWLTEHRRSQREIIAVMIEAGRGLASAHAVGLVHRDVKPSNILVGPGTRVRVTDFGLARAVGQSSDVSSQLGDHETTATGTVLGTPSFMPPEQHRGCEPDARSDQYSFCVTLYAALAGRRPFAADDSDGLLTAKLGGVPSWPDAIPGWLRPILQRGLATDPRLRYAGMDRLLAAIERGRSRRTWIVAGAIASAAIGLAVGGAAMVEAEKDHACTRARDEVAASWSDAHADRLRGAFAATGAKLADDVGGRVEGRLDAWSSAWADARESACKRDDQAAIQCLADARDRIDALVDALEEADADLVYDATRIAASLPSAGTCLDERVQAEVPSPSSALRERIAGVRAQNHRVAMLRAAGRTDAAIEVAAMARAEADALGWAPLVAETALEVALAHRVAGDHDEARKLLEEAARLAIEGGYDALAVDALIDAADLASEDDARPDVAKTLVDVAAAVHQRLDVPGDRREASLEVLRGSIAWRRGDRMAARAHFERGLALRRTIYGERHPATSSTLSLLSRLSVEIGHTDAALAYAGLAAEIEAETHGTEHPSYAAALAAIGGALQHAGDHANAGDHFERALATMQAAYGDDHARVADMLANSAVSHSHAGTHALAEERYLAALAIMRRVLGDAHPKVAAIYSNLALARERASDLEGALAYAEEAVRVHRVAFDSDHPELATAYVDLAQVRSARGEAAEALRELDRAWAVVEDAGEGYELARATVMLGRGNAELALGDATRADRSYRDAIDRFAAVGDASRSAWARFGLARAQWADDAQDAARASAREARAALTGELGERMRGEIDAWLKDR